MPINQDGSCNGLQHYAALGRDIEGARHVNMVVEDEDKPRDLYSKVSDLVADMIEADARNGMSIAKQLNGKISRKVVKQPVMTSVYGVTQYGSIAQVVDQIKDLIQLANTSEYQMYGAYIVSKIFKAKQQLFSNTNLIQQWLKECAIRICHSVRADYYGSDMIKNDKEFGKKFFTSVIWTSPLGSPVVQPYRDPSYLVIKTSLQLLSLINPFEVASINTLKQANGIAPNFIHTLDSTHMILTALKCFEHKISFASVHDSYWTHPADVDSMSSILRNEFVALHSQNWIELLRQEFIQRYDGYLQLVFVRKGTRQYDEVKKYRQKYAAKHKLKNLNHASILRRELALEFKRWKGNSLVVTPSRVLCDLGLTALSGNGSLATDYTDKNICFASPSTDRQEVDGADDQQQNSPKTSFAGLWMFTPIQFPVTPSTGDFDISQVLDNKYFFS